MLGTVEPARTQGLVRVPEEEALRQVMLTGNSGARWQVTKRYKQSVAGVRWRKRPSGYKDSGHVMAKELF